MNLAFIKAIYALWQRDVRKLLRNRSRLLSGLAQPLMYLLALGAGLNSVFQSAGFGNYTTFLSPGIIAMTIMTSSFVSGISVLWDRKFGFLKETLVAPVPRFCIVLGRALGSATIGAVQGFVVLVLSIFFGSKIDGILTLLSIVPMMLLTGMLFSLAGIWCGAIIEDFQSIQLIINFILMPLFFLSGALFPLASVKSTTLAFITHLNPVTYCVDALRASGTPNSHFGLSTDVGVVTPIVLLLLFVSSRAFSRVKVA